MLLPSFEYSFVVSSPSSSHIPDICQLLGTTVKRAHQKVRKFVQKGALAWKSTAPPPVVEMVTNMRHHHQYHYRTSVSDYYSVSDSLMVWIDTTDLQPLVQRAALIMMIKMLASLILMRIILARWWWCSWLWFWWCSWWWCLVCSDVFGPLPLLRRLSQVTMEPQVFSRS